jgi:HEPN domain-containing protein
VPASRGICVEGAISERTNDVPQTHDISQMANQLGVPNRFKNTVSYLESSYKRRYPNDPNYRIDDPEAKIEEVEDLLTWIKNRHT